MPATPVSTHNPTNPRKRRSKEEIAAERQAAKAAQIERRIHRLMKYAGGLSPNGSRYHGITNPGVS